MEWNGWLDGWVTEWLYWSNGIFIFIWSDSDLLGMVEYFLIDLIWSDLLGIYFLAVLIEYLYFSDLLEMVWLYRLEYFWFTWFYFLAGISWYILFTWNWSVLIYLVLIEYLYFSDLLDFISLLEYTLYLLAIDLIYLEYILFTWNWSTWNLFPANKNDITVPPHLNANLTEI